MTLSRSYFIGLLVYVLLVYVSYGLYEIGISINGINQALARGDAVKLEYYVDFDKLRESLKRQVKSEILFQATANRILSVDKASKAFDLIGSFIDLYLSSDGIEKLDELEKTGRLEENSKKARKILGVLRSNKMIGIDGFSIKSPIAFEVMGSDRFGSNFSLIFTWRYLRWVLTDIDVNFDRVNGERIIEFVDQFP